MDRKLNFELVRDKAKETGYTFTQLANEIGVSKESVSKWLNGYASPRPGKAVKLGRILNLSYNTMFGPKDRTLEPQVSFRLSRNQKPTIEHFDRAKEIGRLYEQLVPFLPFNRFETPPQLKSPTDDYTYLDELCLSLRREMGIESDEPLSLPTVFHHLSDKLQAVVVPVFWAHRTKAAELAAHIYSQKTKTTWIPFNLDTKIWDARFWIAHELGHVYTFDSLDVEAGERFSDSFAGTLVFPSSLAKCAYEDLVKNKSKSYRFKVLLEYAKRMHISPICVAKQVDRFAAAKHYDPIHAESKVLYIDVAPLVKKEKTVAQEFFENKEPSISELIEVTSNIFKSPFWETLSKYLKKNGGNTAFIQGLLDCSVADAKVINQELA